jgi:hypothetical protein
MTVAWVEVRNITESVSRIKWIQGWDGLLSLIIFLCLAYLPLCHPYPLNEFKDDIVEVVSEL